MSTDLRTWYDYVLQQMAAEAYLEGVTLTNTDDVRDALRLGNNRLGFAQDKGFTRFTDTQVAEFLSKYQIVAQASDYPDPQRVQPVYYDGTSILANAGMSATLIRKANTNEYTLAIRSTEFWSVAEGGDHERDVQGADLNGILHAGLALAQLSALEEYYSWLKSSPSPNLPLGSILNVTGYSLGGHLATVFTEMHSGDTDVSLQRTITFNGAGRGTWTGNASDPKPIVAYYKLVLANPSAGAEWAGTLPTDASRLLYEAALARNAASIPYDPLNLYNDQRHTWAEYAAQQKFGLVGISFSDQGSSDLRNGAASKITQLYGKEFPFETTVVANSGVHGPAIGVFAEAQPLFEISLNPSTGASNFGNAHALVLIADSVALMRAYQTLDQNADLNLLNQLFSAASNKLVQSGINSKAEDDPLEIMLDALRRLFLGRDVNFTAFKPGGSGFGDLDFRNIFHNNLDQLASDQRFVTWALNQVRFVSLATLSTGELIDAAQGDIAYRYALKELNPFAVADATALYDSQNFLGELSLYSQPGTTPAGMTAGYIGNRAAMLGWLMYRNVSNAGDIFAAAGLPNPILFTDLAPRGDGKPISFRIVPLGSTNPQDLSLDSPTLQRFVFGTDRAEGVGSGPASDGLYGGSGADVLIGRGANDSLEGGTGQDVYVYGGRRSLLGVPSNDGEDTILDTDGKGVLRYTYKPFFGTLQSTVIADATKKLNDTTWLSSDDRFGYELVTPEAGRTDLVVTITSDAGGKLTLKDFRDGDFGIRLRQARLAPTYGNPSNTVAGGDDNPNSLTGTAAADLIEAFAADDTVTGGVGNDLILGGANDDTLSGEADHDRVHGEAGRDSVDGGGGDDELFGGLGADLLEGRDGSDLIVGEDGADFLAGDAGADEIFAGSRDALANALLFSETQTASGLKGEWLDGGDDNDVVVASINNDQLMGGGGADVMVGGAGDDNLVGDSQRTLVHIDNWGVERQIIPSGGGTTYQLAYNGETQVAVSAAGGADLLYGGAGVDWIFGGAAEDFIDAGSGNDIAFGEAGSDVLIGGAGNDVLVGDNPGVVLAADEGGDYLDGGAGFDTIFGTGGDDVLAGGAGHDVLLGGPGKDLYIFEKGDAKDGDTIFDTAATGNDPERSELIFGEGFERENVRFFPGSLGIDLGPSDPADPSSLHDVIHFEGFNPFDPYSTQVVSAIHFADGTSMSFDDILAQGFDIDGTEGDDNEHLGGNTLRGTAVVDRIRGFGGHDLLIGLAGDDLLDAGDGNDELQGGDGIDTLLAGAGSDNLFGEAGDDALLGGDGNDALLGDAGNDALSGDAGPDSIWGGGGDDSLDGGSENDFLYGNDGADTLDGGAGDDTLYAHTFDIVNGVPMLNPLDDDAADVMSGGDGGDYLNAGGGADTLEGNAGDDTLDAEGGDDALDGGDGADDLLGGDGGDVLTGGAGDDAMQGGAGGDFYVFNLGDAHDTIYEIDDAALDTVTFGAGTGTADLSLWQTGSDLNIGHANGTDVLTIANWYLGPQYQVSEFEFADSSVWTSTFANDEGAKAKRGTSGNDSIFGLGIDETISGLAGNDQLFGNSGADTLFGGAGNDTLNGGSGADTYRFELGDGRDVIQESGSGADALVFGAGIAKADFSIARTGNNVVLTHANGTDSVTLQDWFNNVTNQVESITFAATGEAFTHSELTDPFLVLTGTSGTDFIAGGSAYGETILGLAGNDELHGGGGNDSLTGGLGNDSLFGEGGNDRYFFVAGDGQDAITDPTGLNVIQFGPNLVDKVSIVNSPFNQQISFTGTTDSVVIAVGGFYPTLAFELVGTNGADNLSGSVYKDIVSALGGSDSVQGGEGNDEIHSGSGNDTVEGGANIDELWGDEGDDLLDGGLIGPDVSQNIEGYTTRFHGGLGNDTLYGHVAADSYYFDVGDGQDTIFDEPLFDVIWYFSFSDDVIFGPGITSDSIGAHTAGGDLVVDVNATDRVTLKNWSSGTPYRIDTLRFSDGSTMNESQIGDLVNVKQGTPGDDALAGTDTGNERMYGRAGNDTLNGFGGNDLLDGGTGDDLLDGGAGNDTYVVNAGEGTDLVRDSGGADAIQFGAGISAGNVTLERSANNLVLRLPGGSDSVAVENFLKQPASWVETFIFTDGSSLPDSDTIVEQMTAIQGTALDDNVAGTVFVDRLYGMDGNDTLSGVGDDDILNGEGGDDSLAGGAGTDLLAGGAGIDRYQFSPGDGADTIVDSDSGNLVQFGTGIAPQNVVATRAADDLLLTVSGTADRLSVPGYFIGYPIEQFRFADGTIWTVDTIKTKVTTPTSGPDTLIGFETNDALSGLAGADSIYGRGGNDTLDGGLGSDMLYGEDGNDTLIGGTGESKNAAVANSLYGGAGDDVLIGGGNANSGERLDGGAGVDLLLGSVAQDIIYDTGYDGRNSVLFGGAAADTMRKYGGASGIAIGAAGNDRIAGGLGAGVAKTRMLVSFNKSDGIETVDQLALGSTITIGGGTLYSNLSLEVSGSGLRLKTGSSHYVYLSDWYSTASGAGGKAVSTLQIVIEGTRDYKPTSSNPMNNAKIVAFDFLGLVNAFDAARAAGQNFNVANNLAAHRLWSSNTDAIGGAIAYQYARTSSLGTLTHDQMRAVINEPGFGNAPQSIAASASAMASSEEVVPEEQSLAQEQLARSDSGSPGTQSIPGAIDWRDASPDLNASAQGRRSAQGVAFDAGLDSQMVAATDRSLRRGEPGARAPSAGSTALADAATNSAAWLRVARDLPAHLAESWDSGFSGRNGLWNTIVAPGLNGAAMPVVAAVGISDVGRHRLRQFEGLKEGFSSIA